MGLRIFKDEGIKKNRIGQYDPLLGLENKSEYLNSENIGPNAEIFRAPDESKRHDYLRDIGQFSSRIPGLIKDTSSSVPSGSPTFGSADPAYAAIANKAGQQFQQKARDFGNIMKREETQIQDQLLTNEIKRRKMNVDYQMHVLSLHQAQQAARRQKRSAVLGTILGIAGAGVGAVIPGGGVLGAAAGLNIGSALGNVAGGG